MFASPIGAGTEMTPVMHERCNPVLRQDDMDVNPTTSQTDPASASTGINPSPVDGPHQDWPLEMERSEEHTSELQSHSDLVCRLLLEKKKQQHYLLRIDRLPRQWRTHRVLDAPAGERLDRSHQPLAF